MPEAAMQAIHLHHCRVHDRLRNNGKNMMREHNWSDTYTYQAARIHRPRSVDEIRRIVAGASKIRAAATRHTFNGIADTTGDLLDLRELRADPVVDGERRTVTIAAGTTYGELATALQDQGFALHNLGSLPHISVVGAIATGTHGSGDRNRALSSAATALELVTATGDLIQVRCGEPRFDGMVVGLGVLGVVTRLTLDIEPTYQVRQDAFAGLPWSAVLSEHDAIMASAYSVSLMTHWSGETVDRVWLKTRLPSDRPSVPLAHLGAIAAVHPGTSGQADPSLTLFGAPGPWSERLCHFQPHGDPGDPAQIQSEYMVPRSQAAAAITCLRAMGNEIDRELIIGEIRTAASDDLWLSLCYGHDTLALHFTWHRRPEAVRAITKKIEELLLPLGARPHWGKVIHATAAQLASLYPRMADFLGLAREYDPDGKFRNAFLEQHVFGV
jgi:alditol oxidase